MLAFYLIYQFVVHVFMLFLTDVRISSSCIKEVSAHSHLIARIELTLYIASFKAQDGQRQQCEPADCLRTYLMSEAYLTTCLATACRN